MTESHTVNSLLQVWDFKMSQEEKGQYFKNRQLESRAEVIQGNDHLRIFDNPCYKTELLKLHAEGPVKIRF